MSHKLLSTFTCASVAAHMSLADRREVNHWHFYMLAEHTLSGRNQNLSAAVLYPDGTPDLCRPDSPFNFSNLSLKIPRTYVLIKYHFRVNSPKELHASPEPEVSPVLWGQHVNLVKQFTGFRIWREI